MSEKPFIVSTPSLIEQPTLRDQFAMAALTGLAFQTKNYKDEEVIVIASYKIADAMIAERNKQTNNDK